MVTMRRFKRCITCDIILQYTMKQKLSVSLEENLLKLVGELVNTGKFRNKSHLVEYSLSKMIKEIDSEVENEE